MSIWAHIYTSEQMGQNEGHLSGTLKLGQMRLFSLVNLLRLKDLYTHLLEPVDTHAATVGDSFIHLRLIKSL